MSGRGPRWIAEIKRTPTVDLTGRMAEIKRTPTVDLTGRMNENWAYATINRVDYTTPTTLRLEAGTVVEILVNCNSDYLLESCWVKLDGKKVLSEAGLYRYTVTGSCTLLFSYYDVDEGYYGTCEITTQ